MKIEKKIGWHSFRHGLATLSRQQEVDKTAQELLRLANCRITMDIYKQAGSDERRLAQDLAFEGLMGPKTLSTLSTQNRRRKKRSRFQVVDL
ncbi:hypothetical protein DYQ86_07275 [Acidobacteria bacterium AB60]|nr:hypothetical protein DYQ86_07275 [Acidobacteria bacterium AB60]